MLDVARTPPATLARARAIAKRAGLAHVYTGNVHDREGDTTRCASCDRVLIERDWYELIAYDLTADARCPTCATKLAGRFTARPTKPFGRRRVRVRLAAG